MKRLNFRIWDFFLLFCVYSVLSSFLLIITTGGWSGFGVLYSILIGFGLSFIIILIASIVRTFKGHKYVNFSVGSLILLFFTQLTSLLFNRQDCGDTPGAFFFLKKYLVSNIDNLCGWKIHSNYNLAIWMIIMAVYFLTLILFILFFTKKSPEEEDIKSILPTWVKITLRIVGILLVIIAVALFFV